MCVTLASVFFFLGGGGFILLGTGNAAFVRTFFFLVVFYKRESVECRKGADLGFFRCFLWEGFVIEARVYSQMFGSRAQTHTHTLASGNTAIKMSQLHSHGTLNPVPWKSWKLAQERADLYGTGKGEGNPPPFSQMSPAVLPPL